jgi:hypothetical protein
MRGSCAIRRRITSSSSGRVCENMRTPESMRSFQTPCWNHRMSAELSKPTAPRATSSSNAPGSSASIERWPPVQITWMWCPCGTPFRGVGASG